MIAKVANLNAREIVDLGRQQRRSRRTNRVRVDDQHMRAPFGYTQFDGGRAAIYFCHAAILLPDTRIMGAAFYPQAEEDGG